MCAKPSISAPVAAFISHVSETVPTLTGVNGNNEWQTYIPLTVLRAYWTRQKILAFLRHLGIDLEPEDVLKDLRLFSAWVYVNEVHLFTLCVNYRIQQYFPLASTAPFPSHLDKPGYRSACADLRKIQWMFFPCSLDDDTFSNVHLEPEYIWPFAKKDLIDDKRDVSKVYKIELNAACGHGDKCQLHHTDQKSKPNTLILKTYSQSSYYDNERKLFSSLREQNRVNQNIIGYKGSFRQNGTFNLILEYANFGNLEEFLSQQEPPTDLTTIRQLWSSLCPITKGLYGVHQITLEGDDDDGIGYSVQGVHEDIKPDNILLSKDESSTTIYDFTAKLADFGLSDTRPIRADGTTHSNRDRHGNQLYCAPEASHHRRHHKTGKWLSYKVDLFSLGCVLSVCAVFVAFGKKGVDDYLQLRKNALMASGSDNTGLEGCFHDGVNRLKAVDEMHQRVVAHCLLSGDTITPQIIKVIERYMLVSEEARRSAIVLDEEFQQILRRSSGPGISMITPAVANMSLETERHRTDTPQTPNGHRSISGCSTSSPARPALSSPLSAGLPELSSTPTTPLPSFGSQVSPPVYDKDYLSSPDIYCRVTSPFSLESPSPTTNVMASSPTPSRPSSTYGVKISVEQAKNWREAQKNNRMPDPEVAREMRDLQSKVKDRNYIFYVDDSRTMESHRFDTIELFHTLGYIAKGLDADGSIELLFASDFSRNTRCNPRVNKNVTPLLKDLTNCRYQHDVSFTERSIQGLVNNIITRLPLATTKYRRWSISKKDLPISVFIFTDGRWDEWQHSDKQHAIETAISRLMKEVNQRNLDRTHLMIQFIRFGGDLDGKRRLKSLDNFGKADEFKCDIVDTKPSDGCVKMMFIGSICAEIDDASDGENQT